MNLIKLILKSRQCVLKQGRVLPSVFCVLDLQMSVSSVNIKEQNMKLVKSRGMPIDRPVIIIDRFPRKWYDR